MKEEIIYTDDYALIVSDEEMKKGDFNVPSDFDRTSDISITSEEDLEVINDRFNGYKKVIAHRPLTDAPILEGVTLLPELQVSENIKQLAFDKLLPVWDNKDTLEYVEQSQIKAFELGYNKAKETYKYTEEDLRECCSLIFNALGVGDDITTDEIIQHIQQPKRPKYFECEIVTIEPYKDKMGNIRSEKTFPKTITNSKSQTELVGEYIYE